MEYQTEAALQADKHSLWQLLRPARIWLRFKQGMSLLLGQRKIAFAMAVRELRMRYAGQFAGTFWIVGHPLFQMCVFVFVFAVVFKQRIGGTVELPRDYTTYILAGLVPWLSLSSALPGFCGSIVGNANLVKQFAFQLEILAVKDVMISMVFWLIGIMILIVYCLVVDHSLPWTYLLLPVIFALHVMFAVGLGWFLSSVGVFIRDMKDVMTVLVTAGIYVLPVVYLPSWVPAIFRPLVVVNPLSSMIWVYQDALYYGRIEHPYAWISFAALSIFSFVFGLRTFVALKPFFGKAL
ncbi:ABC transporter permease [Bradyrhizobium elkanii]|uniref:ABC transporter permease n=1 Tax=Bradyrhizobium elkanii TaxID=29448 RepID=UPI001AE86335|nr:ABC transporter permease [Bradyrhizobium elkanii]MBP2434201.1 lipopolysaccharide transport system permease protein [Bradyrhizobium elkanii]WLA88888.1 ABC transporter permease [Bradyrhizobium elkanii]